MNVLIIDDEHRRAKPLVDYMTVVRKWVVELALGPSQAMEVLAHTERVFDVVILDIMMNPEGVVDLAASDRGRSTGLLLLDKIRETLRETPIMVYTARIDLDHLRGDPRVAALVQKPSTPQILMSEIERITEQ